MKRFLLFVFAIVAFAACEQAPIEEQSAIRQDAPETLTVGFEGDDTRIQLNEAQKTVWTKGDLVSVFYRSDANQKWEFTGETGARIADLIRVDEGMATEAMKRVVVVYPYNESYYINTDTFNVQATLPAVQSYLKDSYGLNGNIMISQGEYNNISLKSVCGWLKLQLTGNGEKVKSITLKGNNGEQVAGELYINSADATAILSSDAGNVDDGETGGAGGGLVFEDAILKEVVLDCGEGVALGKEATAFYIALPPQTFEQGFTVEIEDTEGYVMEQSTDKALIIERNHIQPMVAMEFTPSVPNNQIWYTSSDGNIVKPNRTDVFGATIISNEYNNGMGVITFDGDVTSIGEHAFYDCTSLTSVNIPDSVTTIGMGAFAICKSLTSITIGDGVTNIRTGAFQYCTSLTKFKCGFADDNGRILVIDGVLTAFAPAGITEYNIPDSVTTIGSYAFVSCKSLTSVNIPDSVTEIGDGVFRYCTSLKEFKGKFATEDGRSLIVDNTIIAYANASGTTYTIPDSVTSIGHMTFDSCDSLTSITIPDSVTTIGNKAFYDCDSLTSVNIPDSVTSIGNEAFATCSSLTSVTIPDSVTTIGGNAINWCTSLTSVYCKATTPPALGDTYVFDNNGSDRKIYVPAGSVEAYKSATRWSEYADAIVGYDFEKDEVVETQSNNEIWYTATTKVSDSNWNFQTFGSMVSSHTFDKTTGKGVITCYGNVTTVKAKAFDYCGELTSISLPESVTSIEERAFSFCYNLQEFKGKFAEDEGKALIANGTLISFARSCAATQYTIPDSVTKIGYNAFYDCDKLKSITIGSNVTTIGYGVFNDCSGLNDIVIPDNVTTLDYWAFGACNHLKSVTIGSGVTSIAKHAFYMCDELVNVYIKATTPPIAVAEYYVWNIFDYNDDERKIYVPAASVEAYKSAEYWSEYADAIVGYDFENGVVVE